MFTSSRRQSKLLRAAKKIGAFAVVLCTVLVATSVSYAQKGGGTTPPADPAIAYIRTGSNSSDIFVMNADGTNAKSIYRGSVLLFSEVVFSPNGRTIAFGSASGGIKIRAIDVAVQSGVPVGLNFRTILDLPESGLGQVRWTPQGDAIVFDYHGSAAPRFPYGPGLYSVPATGGEPVLAFAYPFGMGSGSFDVNPDGSTFVITTSNKTIYTADRATQSYQILGTYPELDSVFGVKWSRSGTRVSFTAHSATLGNYLLYVMDAVPGASRQLVKTLVVMASWSPDDTKMVLVNAGSSRRAHVLTLATGQMQRISSTSSDNFPDWRRF